MAALLSEFQDQLLWYLLEGFWHLELDEEAESGETGKDDHHGEVLLETKVKDLLCEDHHSFSDERDDTSADDSCLGWIYLILIDVEDGELDRDGQLEEEDEDQDDDLLASVSLTIVSALVPQEDQHQSAEPSNTKTDIGQQFPFELLHNEETSDVCDDLRNSDRQSVDVDIELELIQHQRRCIEAEADSTEEYAQINGDLARGFVLEEVDY